MTISLAITTRKMLSQARNYEFNSRECSNSNERSHIPAGVFMLGSGADRSEQSKKDEHRGRVEGSI